MKPLADIPVCGDPECSRCGDGHEQCYWDTDAARRTLPPSELPQRSIDDAEADLQAARDGYAP